MQDKLKESISKNEHSAELFAERKGAAIFLKWAQIPRIIFFSRGHESQEMGSFPRNLVYAELYCFVQSVRYNSGTKFKKQISGHDFRGDDFFFKHRNPYCLLGTKIEKSVTVINAEINVVVNHFFA